MKNMGQTSVYVSPADWQKIIESGSNLNFAFLAETPLYIRKDIQLVTFYSEEVYGNKKFTVKGNAPAGRRIYLSYADSTDFTDNYLISTFANDLGGFAFPRFSIPQTSELVIWMPLYPTDVIGNLKNTFKYWIDYETKDSISSYIVNSLSKNFIAEYKKYATIDLQASWDPSMFYQNNIFLYCLEEEPDMQSISGFTESYNQEGCLNNILYAYKLQEKGQKLEKKDLIILTKSFQSFKPHFSSREQENTFKREESFQTILAWSFFYDDGPEVMELSLSAQISQGYLSTKINAAAFEYVYANDQCNIQVSCSWDPSQYSDNEIRLLSTDISESELELISNFTSPIDVEDQAQRDRICIENLYFAYKKQQAGEQLSQLEETILQLTTRLAPYDFIVTNSSQLVSQKKNFKMTLAWAAFYNSSPSSSQIDMLFIQSEELKMTDFYIEYNGALTDQYKYTYSASWVPSNYKENYIYKYGPTYIPAHNSEFLTPEDETSCINNILYAYYKRQNNEEFTEEEKAIIEASFSGMPVTDRTNSSSFSGEDQASAGQGVILWSIFYNNSVPPESERLITINGVPPCLAGDTLITMANGERKKLSELKRGDKVLGLEGVVEVKKVVVNSPNDFYYKNYFEDGTIIKETSPHRFYNVEQGFSQKLGKWKIGEHAINEHGENIALIKREKVQGKEYKYGLYTSSGTYYANGLLSGPMFINQPQFAEASIEKMVNMIASIDSNRALNFARTGVY